MRPSIALFATALFASASLGVASAQDVYVPTAPEAGPSFGDAAPLQIMTGESVFTTAGDEIGSVEEVAVGADGSQMAIISVGEFLGLGGKQVAISGAELSARAEGGYTVSYTAEQLEAMPEHAAN